MPLRRRYGLSPDQEEAVWTLVRHLTKLPVFEIAEYVVLLSEHFHAGKSVTPWTTSEFQAAYLLYFYPLGVARAKAVMNEAQRLRFLEGIDGFVELGSGPGTLTGELVAAGLSGKCVEISKEAVELHRKLGGDSVIWASKVPNEGMDRQIFCSSYVLNELEAPREGKTDGKRGPEGDLSRRSAVDFDKYSGVLLLEPSTRKDFARLARVRAGLIAKGWTICAPCTHQLACPLANERDWCHDRVEFDPPHWWKELESCLPMKNRTITFSYLLARREATTQVQKIDCAAASEGVGAPQTGFHPARIVGDQMKEKGKTRAMVCRGEEREFLSWLDRDNIDLQLERGDVVALSSELEKKGNEVRVTNRDFISGDFSKHHFVRT